MLYYLGKGTEFKKDECREYKTLRNALTAATKDKTFTVWDENGKIIGKLTDYVPNGALKTNPDGSVPAFDENGHPDGMVDTATVAELTGEGAETAAEGQNGEETIILQGTMRVTVICDGTLNLRRSAEWGNGNICGRASRGQTYYAKAIHTVQGKKMVQTIDNIYLSGQLEHVQIDKI